MFSALFTGIGLGLRRTLRRTALALCGGLFLFAGVAFASVAGWITLADRYDSVVASLVFAVAFIAVGLVLLILSRRSYRSVPVGREGENRQATRSPWVAPALAEAFLLGVLSGVRR